MTLSVTSNGVPSVSAISAASGRYAGSNALNMRAHAHDRRRSVVMGVTGATFDRVLIVRMWAGGRKLENTYKSYCYDRQGAVSLLDRVLIACPKANDSTPRRRKTS